MTIINTAVPTKTIAAIEALPEVTLALNKAIAAGKTMFVKAKLAATSAAAQLDPIAYPELGARVDAVCSAYATTLVDNANVKAIFKDALILAGSAQAPVTIVNRKGEEVHTTADAALLLPKHDMKKAAQAVRADNGFGRKTAVRAPKTPTAQPVDSVNVESVMRIVASNLFADNAEFIKALTETCLANGYIFKAIKVK